ncbi:MAG: helix-turn-helix transcriptional regulator [Microbacterium sp.]
MSRGTTQRRFASLKTACEYIDVTERTLRNYIARGELTGYRFGSRSIRIDLDELEKLLTPIPTAGGEVA